jgi:hypothetical protein
MTSLESEMTQITLFDSSAGPGILIKKAASSGDIAVPGETLSTTGNAERMSLGHAAGSGSFFERLAIVGGAAAAADKGWVYVNSTISYNGVVNRSDRRYKKNIKNFWIDPQAIYGLPLVEYEWDNEKLEREYGKQGLHPEGVHRGIIAQDVQEVLPWAYSERTESSIASYSQLGVLFASISAIQDLNKRIKDLEARIAELEG